MNHSVLKKDISYCLDCIKQSVYLCEDKLYEQTVDLQTKRMESALRDIKRMNTLISVRNHAYQTYGIVVLGVTVPVDDGDCDCIHTEQDPDHTLYYTLVDASEEEQSRSCVFAQLYETARKECADLIDNSYHIGFVEYSVYGVSSATLNTADKIVSISPMHMKKGILKGDVSLIEQTVGEINLYKWCGQPTKEYSYIDLYESDEVYICIAYKPLLVVDSAAAPELKDKSYCYIDISTDDDGFIYSIGQYNRETEDSVPPTVDGKLIVTKWL